MARILLGAGLARRRAHSTELNAGDFPGITKSLVYLRGLAALKEVFPDLTINGSALPPDVQAMVEEAFAFLLPRTSEVQIDRRRDGLVVAYCSPGILFEVEVDSREKQAFVLVCRSDSGQRPAGYYTYQGRLVRKQLEEVVAAIHPSSDTLSRVSRRVVAARQNSSLGGQLSNLAEVLRDHETELRDVAAQLFDLATPAV